MRVSSVMLSVGLFVVPTWTFTLFPPAPSHPCSVLNAPSSRSIGIWPLRYGDIPDDEQFSVPLPADWRSYRAALVMRERQEAAIKASGDRGLIRRRIAWPSFANGLNPPEATQHCEDVPSESGDADGGVSTKALTKDWAHPIPHLEPGCLLLASPNLRGVYARTAVLLLSHTSSASLGLVINRVSPLAKAMSTGASIDRSIASTFSTSQISSAGPISPNDVTVLHPHPLARGSREVSPGLYVGGGPSLRSLVRSGELSPTDALFARGRSVWVRGQLRSEVERGIWHVASASPGLVLAHREANAEDTWKGVLRRMGGRYSKIAEAEEA